MNNHSGFNCVQNILFRNLQSMFYSFWMEWSDKRKSNPEWIVCVDVTVNNWMFVLWIYWFSCILFCNVCHMNGSTIVFGCTAEKLISVGKTKEKTSNWIDLQCICPSLILIKFSVVHWSSWCDTTACAMVQHIESQNIKRIESK